MLPLAIAVTLTGCLSLGLALVAASQQLALRAIRRELERREAAATAWLLSVEAERLKRAEGLEDAIRGISRAVRGPDAGGG